MDSDHIGNAKVYTLSSTVSTLDHLSTTLHTSTISGWIGATRVREEVGMEGWI